MNCTHRFLAYQLCKYVDNTTLPVWLDVQYSWIMTLRAFLVFAMKMKTGLCGIMHLDISWSVTSHIAEYIRGSRPGFSKTMRTHNYLHPNLKYCKCQAHGSTGSVEVHLSTNRIIRSNKFVVFSLNIGYPVDKSIKILFLETVVFQFYLSRFLKGVVKNLYSQKHWTHRWPNVFFARISSSYSHLDTSWDSTYNWWMCREFSSVTT